MPDLADDRYSDDAGVAFAIYCDEHGLTVAEGRTLAEQIGDALADVADNRSTYVPIEEA